jgi:hypothetical protein
MSSIRVTCDRTVPRPPAWAEAALAEIDRSLRFRFIPCVSPGDHSGCEKSRLSMEPLCGHWVLERRVDPIAWGTEWEWERPEWVVDYVLASPDGGYAPITGDFVRRLRDAYIHDVAEWKRAVREALRRRHEREEAAIVERINDFGDFLAFVYTPKVFISR